MKPFVIVAATLALAVPAAAQTAPNLPAERAAEDAAAAAEQAARNAEAAAQEAAKDTGSAAALAAGQAEHAADTAADAAAAAAENAAVVRNLGEGGAENPNPAAEQAADAAAEEAADAASEAADTAAGATRSAAETATVSTIVPPDVNPPAISEAEPGLLGSWVTSRRIWTTNQPSSTEWVDPELDERPAEWQDIAKVNDIVLDDSGRVVGYVADIGGFLGIGAKKVLLGVDAIHLVTVDNDTFFATNYTKQELQALPDFDEKTVRR